MTEQVAHKSIVSKALAMWRREGTVRLLSLLWNRMAGIFYVRRSFYLLRRDITGPVQITKAPGVEARLAAEADFPKLAELMYLTPAEVKAKVQSGCQCMLGLADGEIAGYSWINYEKYYISDVDYEVVVQPGQAYFGPGFVHPHYRGRRVHSVILDNMCEKLRSEGIQVALSSVNVTNYNSIKGLVRSSFYAIERIDYRKTLRRRQTTKVKLPTGFVMQS